jgi:hypothetical protein
VWIRALDHVQCPNPELDQATLAAGYWAGVLQENLEIVRKPLAVREHSSRTLEERLALRLPRLAAAYAHLIGRLPPSSRLRRAAVRRAARLAAEAFNRRDLGALQVGRRPDCEFHPAHEFVEAGFLEPCYRGPAGYRRYVSDWSDVWGADLRLVQVDVIDLGDRNVALGRLPVRAQASGVSLTGEWATVSVLKHGMCIDQQEYLDHTEALEAVGLRE